MIVKNRITKFINSPFLPHIVAPIILISPVIFSGKALFWGTPATQFVPWWKFSFDTILAGHLPLWNPQSGMGAPLIANYQSALFYPPNWLYFISYVIGGLPVLAWTQAIIVTGHLILSSIGMSLFCRRMGLGKLAQSISGIAFGLSGFLVSRAWFSSVNAVISWLPWVLMYAHEMVLTKKKSSWIKLVIVLSLQLLAGHAQLTWYTWLLVVAWILQINFNKKKHLDQKLSLRLFALVNHLMKFGTALCVSIGISAVQLLPTAEYLMQSQRATAANYESAMTYSFWPWRLVGLIAPNLFGNPVNSDYWGYGNFWEDSIYVGLLPIIMASVYLLKRNKKKVEGVNQETRSSNERGYDLSNSTNKIFFIFMILASIFLALGQNTPIFPFLYDHIPTFDMFRAPTRFTIWMVFLISLCAGYGVDQWKRPIERGLYWTRLGTAGAFAVTLGAGFGWWLFTDVAVDFKPTFVPAIATTGLLGLVCGLLALSAPKEESGRNKKRTFWNWGVILFVCVDLLYMGWGLNPGIDLDFYKETPAMGIKSDIKKISGRVFLLPHDESNLRFEEFFRPETFEPTSEWNILRTTLLPNINLLDGISMVNNYDPLVPGRFEHWMEKINQIDLNSKPEILDIMGVSIIEDQGGNRRN